MDPRLGNAGRTDIPLNWLRDALEGPPRGTFAFYPGRRSAYAEKRLPTGGKSADRHSTATWIVPRSLHFHRFSRNILSQSRA